MAVRYEQFHEEEGKHPNDCFAVQEVTAPI
jgi:hypothetical protein